MVSVIPAQFGEWVDGNGLLGDEPVEKPIHPLSTLEGCWEKTPCLPCVQPGAKRNLIQAGPCPDEALEPTQHRAIIVAFGRGWKVLKVFIQERSVFVRPDRHRIPFPAPPG